MAKDPSEYPLTALTPEATGQYAITIAVREARNTGVLTDEEFAAISARSNEILDALFHGKIVELDAKGSATIRDARTNEEKELGADQFPLHAASKKSLDI